MAKRLLYACRRRPLQILAGLLALALCGPAGAFAQKSSDVMLPPCAACVAVVITPPQSVLLPAQLAGLDVLVRVAPGTEPQALAALEYIRHAGGRAGLLIDGLPAAPPPTEVLARASVVLVLPHEMPDADGLAYALKTQITRLRGGAAREIQAGLAARRPVMEALLRRDLGPYLDLSVWLGGGPASDAIGGTVWRAIRPEIPELSTFAEALAATQSAPAERWLWRLPEDAGKARALLGDLSSAAPLLAAGLLPADSVSVRCEGRPAEVFLEPRSLAIVALARGCASGSAVTVAPSDALPERVDLASGDMLLRIPAAATGDRFAEGVDVIGQRTLSAEEIVARHQSAAARQAAAARTLISTGSLTITFEAPGFPAPVSISSDTIVYTGGGRVDLEQRRIRVNGVGLGDGGVPRLPILEPERAAAPPLAITLTNLYRYALDGEASLAGVRCHVLRFTPIDATRSLYRGRVWISADDFGMVRVSAVQTSLRGAIVSSEQIDEFRRERPGIWLLHRSEVRQLYEGAAHRTPIHRVLAIARHDINPADFEARRRAAYASDHVLLRDTAEGYRYLRRDRAREGEAPSEPVIAPRAHRVRTLVAGVIVDPNISRPLPFAGVSYVDFNLLGTGTQLNAFFGGAYGQLAFSVPSIGGSRWQLAGRAFGIASSYNDRSFVDGRERYDENIRQRPANAAVWLLRPLTARITVRAGYDLDYTHLARADRTASDFVVPADQLVHAARVAVDAQRGGWHASLWWNPARRQGWRAWGPEGARGYERRRRDFQRYGAALSRSLIVKPGLVARIDAAWMAGRDLDRFSRFSFGTFDNRLRGYPSALIRYDRGFVGRAAVAWSAGRLLRVDGFVDTAAVGDPGFGRGLRNYTGLGAGLEAPAPFGTLLALEWGYGIRGVNADGSHGTHVVRVSAFKIF